MKKNDIKEPNVWVTALKLLLGASVIVGGVGFALWMAAQRPTYSPALEQAQQEVQEKSPKPPTDSSSWGISKDSPVRR